jgi:hypothetical protein
MGEKLSSENIQAREIDLKQGFVSSPAMTPEVMVATMGVCVRLWIQASFRKRSPSSAMA